MSQFALHHAIQLEPEEIAIFLTDGVTESTTPDGSQFGTQRVLDYVRSRRQDPAEHIARGIYQAARAFAHGDLQDDDITSVLIKVDRSR